MSTETLELIELDESLDFNPSCDYCDEGDAKWALRHGTVVHPICDACKIAVEEAVRKSVDNGYFLWCNVCDADDQDHRYFPEDISIEPL